MFGMGRRDFMTLLAGGATGTLLSGVFAVAALSASPDSPEGSSGLLEGNARHADRGSHLVRRAHLCSAQGGRVPLAAAGHEQHEIEDLDVTKHGEALQ